jgi:hypothetical protein
MKNQIFALVAASVLLLANNAKADGFRCESAESSLGVLIYNHVMPHIGTRSGAVMVIYDAEYVTGKQTISKFESADRVVGSDTLTYTGIVDLRYNNTGSRYDMIMGMTLSEIKYLIFRADFTYSRPVKDGAPVSGTLIAVKRSGQQVSEEFECTRYLKLK